MRVCVSTCTTITSRFQDGGRNIEINILFFSRCFVYFCFNRLLTFVPLCVDTADDLDQNDLSSNPGNPLEENGYKKPYDT